MKTLNYPLGLDFSNGGRQYSWMTQPHPSVESPPPEIIRGSWELGVVELSNGDLFVKVVSFPVTDDSDYGGESMWVLVQEGDESEGIGILDNEPLHSDIVCGSLIEYRGGSLFWKPHFVRVVGSPT